MKPRIIISVSLIALIIFLLIQFYTVINVYQVKSNDFDTRYNKVIQDAMNELTGYSPDQGLDSMYLYLDQISFYYKDLEFLDDLEIKDSIKTSIINDVVGLISALEPFSNVISYKLDQEKMDPNIKAGFIIHDFGLLDDLNLFPIIRNDTLIFENKNAQALNLNLQGSLLDNFRAERNYFAINFDVYVDFTRKQQIIFSEMIGVLILITLSILIISFVFYFTIRNLMKQKKISDLKSDFINNMTHELKTPLATISLASHGLSNDEMRKDDGKIKELSKIISRQNKHLTQIIDQILDISIWEKKKINLDIKPIDFVNFLNEKIDSFRMVHEEVYFEILIPQTAINIQADSFQLSLALNNLFENAVKYKKESLRLKVEIVDNQEGIILKISDNGIGISPNDQKHIFDKFYRVDNSSIHNTKGLGLGLFYVKNIIEAHAGEIWLDSELKKGTTFFIRFNK